MNIQLPAIFSDTSYTPVFFRLANENDINSFNEFLSKNTNIFIYDTIQSQLRELIKSLNPSRKLSAEETKKAVENHLAGRDSSAYGVWVYYPWARRLVHLLDEEEFIEVRTNRNQYKITREERDFLTTKKIGIIGLSVGQSIALSLAMERSFGELRLADFDELELSNLNRIRTPLHNMGLKKVTAVAREIAELDPFIKVTCFEEGLTEENIDTFFTAGGKLDILVDECDGLDMKIVSRVKAKALGIPVVMDTSDRGMLDVERFDLEPDRPLLHGLVGDLDPNSIKGLTNEQKIPYMLPMIGAQDISPRLKASMMEVEQTINTWPQLATSVILGGAVGADVCRRILLDQFHDSGRYYIDLEELIADRNPVTDTFKEWERPVPLSPADVKNSVSGLDEETSSPIPSQIVDDIVTAAATAPSGGNAQPWKWASKNGHLYLLHDRHYSYSLLDYGDYGSYVALGAAIENAGLRAKALGYAPQISYFPKGTGTNPIADIALSGNDAAQAPDPLAGFIFTRLTNRNKGDYKPLNEGDIEKFTAVIDEIKDTSLNFITDRETMKKLGNVVAKADKVRMMHEQGHRDTFISEMRWDANEAETTRDGIDIATVGVTASEAAGF
ncbi:MAG TPA: Rv1355c family protein, partial [Bacteroidia bacterium]|nr:Rv1355c family protein [Bacteroidia bacterium]